MQREEIVEVSQSAAILVVKPGGGYGGDTDLYLDLRVDDHQDPVNKLSRLVEMHHLFFGSTVDADLVTIDEQIATELQLLLKGQGYDVVDVDLEVDEFDTVCDYIVTPNHVVHVEGRRKPTAGIIWNKLSDGMMNDIPSLQELKLIDP